MTRSSSFATLKLWPRFLFERRHGSVLFVAVEFSGLANLSLQVRISMCAVNRRWSCCKGVEQRRAVVETQSSVGGVRASAFDIYTSALYAR